MSNLSLYWGDLHSHCAISYGHGSIEAALARARQQLDFASVTGHAFWPDMPVDRAAYAQIIDYHHEGFATLASNWQALLVAHRSASETPGFVALPSYEWHSLRYGDHNVYAPCFDLPLRDAPDLPALREVIAPHGGLAIPHHIGYRAGYRGIDWSAFRAEQSPFVEIFSLHGCSLGERAPYPMLHDMGPRDAGSTAETGWRLGHRFGIVGGTDHHAAYPGSHGDGRMGVFATANTPEALFEAFRARRVFAATGDRIDARLFVEDAWIGQSLRVPGRRRLRVRVRGMDAVDRVDVFRNDALIRRYSPQLAASVPQSGVYRLRLSWGWGRNTREYAWEGTLSLQEGKILRGESCFRGQAVVAPNTNGVDQRHEPLLPHALLTQDERGCTWRSVTTGNLTMRHPTFQALSLEVDGSLETLVRVAVNDQSFSYRLGDLLTGARSHYMDGWLSEAICIGPAVPEAHYVVSDDFDDDPCDAVDRYRLEVIQTNGQCAWLTPIWVDR